MEERLFRVNISTQVVSHQNGCERHGISWYLSMPPTHNMKLRWLSLLFWEQLLSQIHVLLSTIFLCVGCNRLIIPVLLSFAITVLWSQQQKGPDSCILSEVIFLFSCLPTLNSEPLPLLALNKWKLYLERIDFSSKS